LKRHLARILIGLAITLFFVWHAAQTEKIGLIDRLDNIIYDARLRMTMPERSDPGVIILDIDEKSLGEVGHWPWSRKVMARLMDKLFDEYQVLLVGFDVFWAERDPSSGVDTLDSLARKELRDDRGFRSAYERLRGRLDYDALFAASMKGRAVVLGYFLSSEDKSLRLNAIPPPALGRNGLGGHAIPATSWKGYTGNLPVYVANAASAGHINPIFDDDGIVRRVPLLAELDGEYYESLSLAVVRTLLAMQEEDRKPPPIEPGFPADGDLEWLKVGPLTIPVDKHAAALIPFLGPRFSFEYLSLADVLAGRVKPEQLRGRIALIGTSAQGLQDLRPTPVSKVYPGVEVHANLISGIMAGTLKKKPGYVVGAEAALLLLGGVTLSLLIPVLTAPWATLAALVGAALITAIDFAVWVREATVLPLAASLLMTALIYTVNMSYGYFVVSRSKRLVAALFGEYIPPELVDQMADDPEKYRKYNMQPKAADLTILFSDVRGFTGISEALKPEDLREYINEYLTDMSRIIRSRHRGTLDKYIGDAIMAFWGAPVEDPQHARNGVLAALEMQRECKVLNGKFLARGWPALGIGVGLNSGHVRVGDMGSQVRRAYTAMGDPVNVASRLEARTKHYGVGILVGEATRNAVQDVVFREVDRVKVKGKDEALSVYEPLGLEGEVDARAREELALWDEALRGYRAQEWDRAEARLQKLQRLNPNCGLYRMFAAKVADRRRSPPPAGWDGVTVFDEK